MRLTRELRFALTADDPGRLDNTWAGSPAVPPLVPFLRIHATVVGEPDARTGYICDIKDLDVVLREACTLATAGAALHELLLCMWAKLPDEVVPGARLVQLTLLPTPFVSYTLRSEHPDMVEYTEQFEFAAAHRLHCASLSDEENRRLFGKCNNPRGHGHNYIVEVTVQLPPAPHLLALQRVVRERVLERFDHKHLNEDTVEFRELNPSVENIAQVVWRLLVEHVAPARLSNVRIYETPKTWADCDGG